MSWLSDILSEKTPSTEIKVETGQGLDVSVPVASIVEIDTSLLAGAGTQIGADISGALTDLKGEIAFVGAAGLLVALAFLLFGGKN